MLPASVIVSLVCKLFLTVREHIALGLDGSLETQSISLLKDTCLKNSEMQFLQKCDRMCSYCILSSKWTVVSFTPFRLILSLTIS